jgi:hypothetical protein
MKKTFIQIIVGFLLSAFLSPLVHAQFGGVVTVAKAPTVEALMVKIGATQVKEDWKRFLEDQQTKRAQHAAEMAQHKLSFAKQVQYYADQALAWINQFEKTATQIRTAMSQLNTARGLFGLAEAAFGLDANNRKNLAEWFRAYESVLTASRGALRLWQSRYSMVNAIKRFQSMPSGFNPEQLWGIVNDFIFRVNRAGEAKEQALRAMMERDPVLGGLWEQWGQVNRRLSDVSAQIFQIRSKMDAETQKSTGATIPPPQNVTGETPKDPAPAPGKIDVSNVSDNAYLKQLAQELAALMKEKSELETKAMELMERMKKRFEELHIPLEIGAFEAEAAAAEANAWMTRQEEQDEALEKGLSVIFNYDPDTAQ